VGCFQDSCKQKQHQYYNVKETKQKIGSETVEILVQKKSILAIASFLIFW